MIRKRKEPLSQVVGDDEPLARFLFQRNQFSKEKERVRRQAFDPPKDKNKVSVFRVQDCSKDCFLKIREMLEQDRKKTSKAVAYILTKKVRYIDGLDVESDISNNQHRRHANIINFSYPRAKRQEIAQELANEARLELHSELF